ncbi:MAG: hypothetical protein IKQ18_00990, partial [Clostridia bacterium]|nr:hypothetical protein [Clostridia bacterium]
MKKILSIILSALFLLPVISGCTPQETVTTDGITTNADVTNDVTTDEETKPPVDCGIYVDALRVNYEIEPSCIDDTPSFSWVVNTDKRNIKQTS